MTTGIDSTTGQGLRTSFTHHGDAASAERCQTELVQMYGAQRIVRRPRATSLTVQELLEAFLSAPHRWSATTWRSYRGQAALLCRDRIHRARVSRMTPNSMEQAIERWVRAGVTPANLSGRFRTLHAAISWAVHNQLLPDDPLVGMTCPSRPGPRLHLRAGEISKLIHTADELVDNAAAAVADYPHRRDLMLALFRAEQDALMVRLTPDSAVRRGELVALQITDLEGRKLTIERASQDGVIGPVKNHLKASMTVGNDTAFYWRSHVANWSMIPNQGPWLFSDSPSRSRPLLPDALVHRFEKLARAADLPGASLHRMRHTVATYLVAEGKLLQASKRLRHRDVSTTLREYAHALPLDDEHVADTLAKLYGLEDE